MATQAHTVKLAMELANRPMIQVISETGALAIIAVIALLGNASVLYVFFKSPSFRSVTNYYLIALAISDVTYSLTIMSVSIAHSAYGGDVLGSRIGTAFGILAYILVGGSLQMTTLIAINRFFCVVKPQVHRKYFRPKPGLIMIVAMWIFAVLNVAAAFLSGIAKYEFYPGRFSYLLTFEKRTVETIYYIISLLFFVILPMLVAGLCYWNIYRIVTVHKNTVANSSLNNEHGTNGQGSSNLSKKEIHITRSLLALVCGFVICWLPCSVVNIVAIFYDLPRHVEMIFTYTSAVSTAINPIIFNIFNKPFRKRYLSIFCSRREEQNEP